MKKVKFLVYVSIMGLVLTACSNDDDAPEIVNEEEVITTLTVTLVPEGGGESIILQTQDLDGEGPNAPVVTVSGNLMEGTEYNGSLVVLNETESPAENITEEVEEEADEHQFLFTVGGNLDVTTTYTSFDGNDDPLGTSFDLTANSASSGTLTVTLRHEPKKPNDGTLADAGGETDISATFSLIVE
ncbi:MAG: type 1 periplasmic binding fold superfamily protein [Sediminicola sp.]